MVKLWVTNMGYRIMGYQIWRGGTKNTSLIINSPIVQFERNISHLMLKVPQLNHIILVTHARYPFNIEFLPGVVLHSPEAQNLNRWIRLQNFDNFLCRYLRQVFLDPPPYFCHTSAILFSIPFYHIYTLFLEDFLRGGANREGV